MEQITLTAEKRDGGSKKGELSSMRGAAQIPGVVYGGDKPSVQVSLSEKELMAARKKGGLNAVLKLKIGSAVETVILKELQRHPVTDRPVHADFQRISLSEKIEAKVPLRIVGEAPGVKTHGGVMQHELRVLSVKGLPTEIPHQVDVDVSHLGLNERVLVKELRVAPGIEVLDDPEHLVVHVTQVKEEVAEPAPAEAAAAAEAAPAEPELSTTKGKKDEEGKPLPKDAKAAPAPEKGKEPGKKEGK